MIDVRGLPKRYGDRTRGSRRIRRRLSGARESVDTDPAPQRIVLGSQAQQSTIDTLRTRSD